MKKANDLFKELKEITNEKTINNAVEKLADPVFIASSDISAKLVVWIKELIVFSLYDNITRILQKQIFEELLKESLNFDSNYLIFADLDNFKKINDKYGHKIGDDVLKHVANILNSSFRRTNQSVFQNLDLVGRYGGDEFIIFMSNCKEEVVKDRINLFYSLLSKPFCIDDENSFLIGITLDYIKYDKSLTFEENFEKIDYLLYKKKFRKKDN